MGSENDKGKFTSKSAIQIPVTPNLLPNTNARGRNITADIPTRKACNLRLPTAFKKTEKQLFQL